MVGGSSGQALPAAGERFLSLQYLRGIAALMVFLAHFDDLPGLFQRLRLAAQPPQLGDASWLSAMLDVLFAATNTSWLFALNFGSGGVAIFFLISGFVIALSAEKLSFVSFGIRRVFRLYPTLWASLAIILALTAVARLVPLGPLGHPVVLVVRNAALAGGELIDQAVWTLMIEVKFYALIAVVLLFAKRLTGPWILGLALSVFLLALPYFLDPTLEVAGLGSRFWRQMVYAAPFLDFMLIGTVIYNVYFGRMRWPVALAMVALLYALFAVGIHYGPPVNSGSSYIADGWRALVIVGGALCLEKLILRSSTRPRARPLHNLFGWLGDISYPLYLLHGVPGGTLLAILLAAGLGIDLALVLVFAAVFGASWLVHRLIEIPGQRLGANLARRADRRILALSRKSAGAKSEDGSVMGAEARPQEPG